MNFKNLFFACILLTSFFSCSDAIQSEEYTTNENSELISTRSDKTLVIPSDMPQKIAFQQFEAFVSNGIPNKSYFHTTGNSSGDLIITEMFSETLGEYNPTTGLPVTEESVLYEGTDMLYAFLALTFGSDCGPPYDIWQDGNGTIWVTDCC